MDGDDVHSGHGEAGAIHHTTDAARPRGSHFIINVSKPYIINHILHLKIYGYGYKDINQLPAVEADVVQVVLGRVDLPRILLCLVALSEHALLPELGVVVKVQLGVGDVDLTCLIGCLEGVNRLLVV
jgi:hypothetical protein